jgi:hypothetical protein
LDIAFQQSSVVLGFLTLGAILSVFASCRSCVSLLTRLGSKNPLASKAYQSFFRYHSLYWETFFIFLVAHLSLAFAHTGIPQNGDPDAPVHWTILSLGLTATTTTGLIFSSCRISNNLLIKSFKSLKSPQKNYRVFYAFHGYYWFVALAVIAAHFFFAHSHVGFWPMPGM